MRRDWRGHRRAALLAIVGGVAMLALACGGSGGTEATPTAKPLPSRPAAQGTPGFRGGTPPANFTPPADFTPGAGGFGMMGGLDSGLADFLGITQEQLQSELAVEGATLGTVADAHGKTRGELKAFLVQQIQANADQAVADGRMTQDEADTMVQDSSSQVDDMIDGTIPLGGRFAPPTAEPGQ